MAGRPSGKQTGVRLSSAHLKRLVRIRECGDFPDDSAALRWCIDFTGTMLRLIPAAVAETYISSFTEPDGTTSAPEAAPDLFSPEPFISSEGTTCVPD